MEKGPTQSGLVVTAARHHVLWFVVLLSAGTLWGDEPTCGSLPSAPAFQPAEIWVGGKLVSGPQPDLPQPPEKPQQAQHAELSEVIARELIHALNYAQPSYPDRSSIREAADKDTPPLDSKPACVHASSDSLQSHPRHHQASPEDRHGRAPDNTTWQPARRPTPPSTISSTGNGMPASDEVRPIAVFAPSTPLRAASQPVPRSNPLAADRSLVPVYESSQPQQTAPAMQRQDITGEVIAAWANAPPVPVGYVSSAVSLDHADHGRDDRMRNEPRYEQPAVPSDTGSTGAWEPASLTPAAALTNLLPTTLPDVLNGFLLGITLTVFTLGLVGLLLWQQNAVFRIEVLHATPSASQAPVTPTSPLAGHACESQHTSFGAPLDWQSRGSRPGPSLAAATHGRSDTSPLQPLPSWESGPEMLLGKLETTFDQRRKEEEQHALEMEAAMLDEIFAENLKLRDTLVVTS